MSRVHLIYYDENMDFDSENYGYVKQFKNRIKGAFFPVKNKSSFQKLINKLKLTKINGTLTLITSGRAAEKIIPICSSLVNNVIIFCYNIDRYLPLKKDFPKINNILNSFSDIFYNLNDCNINNDSSIIGGNIITFEDYTNTYYKYHSKLAEFFDENYKSLNYKTTYKNKFINFIESEIISRKSNIIDWVNRVSEGTVKQFIEAYTGETELCYSLNRWLRNLDNNQYDSIKYFAGPFSYALYQYANKNRVHGIYQSKTFYRKMTIKLSDYYLYKIFVGELICYPAFTSTSEKDISKYNFPTNIAIEVNNLSANDISVVLIIRYNCNLISHIFFSYPTPCVNASQYSVNSGEEEYIFPPFSFFKIESIEERDGNPNNPHIIHMSTPNKKNLLEFELKKGKKIYYNRNENYLYSS